MGGGGYSQSLYTLSCGDLTGCWRIQWRGGGEFEQKIKESSRLGRGGRQKSIRRRDTSIEKDGREGEDAEKFDRAI